VTLRLRTAFGALSLRLRSVWETSSQAEEMMLTTRPLTKMPGRTPESFSLRDRSLATPMA